MSREPAVSRGACRMTFGKLIKLKERDAQQNSVANSTALYKANKPRISQYEFESQTMSREPAVSRGACRMTFGKLIKLKERDAQQNSVANSTALYKANKPRISQYEFESQTMSREPAVSRGACRMTFGKLIKLKERDAQQYSVANTTALYKENNPRISQYEFESQQILEEFAGCPLAN
ncbi:hypothetical protein BaRGS_00024242 [Batillaria attramentaria]|uniref:Uncharacterized protein n=1 Tax=Batillaria attramentaria TaxID=370345 RepID=A0ABD0KBL3_9CAEN